MVRENGQFSEVPQVENFSDSINTPNVCTAREEIACQVQVLQVTGLFQENMKVCLGNGPPNIKFTECARKWKKVDVHMVLKMLD